MKEKSRSLEHEIKQRIEERMAENDALKKLIVALHEEETKQKSTKINSGKSSQIKST